MFLRILQYKKKNADIHGHSSIEIPRIYIVATSADHCRKMETLRLLTDKCTKKRPIGA